MPYADAKSDNSVALAYASAQENQEMFDLLYPVSDLHEAMTTATNLNFKPRQHKLLYDRLNMEQEHRTLTEATNHIVTSPKAKKI